ncbi:U3 snoRNP protein [Malassezia equina]|uniref:U3 snoRNP protein n=1 Tax=Malassezia equina TaxID=1381935 RepID=A0AAF0J0B4_9BASI|nr:U3 snoRNP protein [Malassezia equina]
MGDSAVRHRYVSFHERLKHVTIDLTRDSSTSWGTSGLQVAGLDAPASAFAVATGAAPTVTEASDLQSTAFGSALQQWNELNLSLPFQSFYANVMPKAQSLVLLVHHRDEIAAALDAGLTLREPQNWLAWDALLDLVPRMAFDLGSEFLLVYPTLLTALLRASSLMDKNLTRGDEELAARLVERAFHSAAWLFRAISSLMSRSSDAQLLVASWTIVRDLLTSEQAPIVPATDENDDEDDADHAENETAMRSARPMVRSHTRRFATEALAHLIRKAPLSQLGVLVHSMRIDSQTYGPELDSGIAATWAHSCKTAAHALHSRTRELLSCVLDWDAPFAASIERWGERIMTALVHHARAADMVPVLEWLLQRSTESPLAELPACLVWLTAALGTRKGTRVDDSFKTHFFAWLPKLDARMVWTSSAAHRPLLRAYTSLICVTMPLARVQDMTGPGKQVLQAFATRYEREPFDVAWAAFDGVYRALGDPALGWRSFGALALPTALDATSHLLSGNAPVAQEDAALAFLAELDIQGHLAALHDAPPTTIVLRWTKRTQKKVQQRLDQLASLLDSGRADDQVLASMPAVPLACRFPNAAPTMARLLVRCIQAVASRADTTTRHVDGIVGTLLATLVAVLHAPSAHVKESVQVLFDGERSIFARLLQTSASSHAVLPALADLAEAVHAPSALPSVHHLWPMLTSALLDPNRAIVHAALRLLALVTEGPLNVCALLAEVEAMPLDVPNVTARNVKLRYAQREACKALKGTDVQMQALVRYSIGTLKLNLKPVWAASRETLVALSARVSEEVWRVSFVELQAADALVHAGPVPSDEAAEEDEEEEEPASAHDDARDDLYQLHDPQLSRRLRTLRREVHLDLVTPAQRAASAFQARATPHVRFDAAHYATELLLLYAQHAVLPEKHSEAFVSHVLAQWSSLVDAQDSDRAPSAARTERLRQFLAIFAEFREPAKMFKASVMQEHFLALCAQPEITVQRGALSCLLTWKPHALVHMEDKLRNLLDTAKFRDTLSQLDLSATSDQFSAVTRPEVMPVLIRLLFGLMISRRGVRTSGAGQHARRTAILSALYESQVEELQLLVDLMLSAFEDQVVPQPFVLPPPPEAPMRKQLGLLQMLGEVLRHLGRALRPCMHRLVGVVVSLAAHAADATDEQAREVRRAALRRLADFVRYGQGIEWVEFREPILARLVHPRLATFAQDSVQAPSAFLDLCRTWISETDTLLCFMSDTSILPAIYAGLSSTSIKPLVAQAILDMAERLLGAAEADEDIRVQVVLPMVPALLEHLQPLVRHTIRSEFTHPLAIHVRDDLLRQELSVLSQLAPHIETQTAAARVVELLVPLMRHSARAIPERTKTELLRTFSLLLPRAQTSGDLLDNLYGLFCRLGSELRSRQARSQYAEAFAQLATAEPSLTRISQWVRALNAYSTRMVDEPDLEQRLTACDTILHESTVIHAREWHALLYHALFYICDEELAMRTNASAMLQRFVREARDPECVSLVTRVLLPGMRRRLHSRSEAVRKELFQLLGVTVAEMSDAVPALAELHVLRAGGDEEASVFTNLYHIQTHRRVRAMHRLAQAAEHGALRSKTLSELFLPLAWFFLLPNQSGGIDINMANEALACIRRMAAHLQWSHYYHWLSRFLRELKEHAAKEETSAAERLHVRGVVGVLEAFHFDCNEEVSDAAATQEEDQAEEQAYDEQALARDLTQPSLEAQREQKVALAATLTTRVLPPLHEALHVKNEDRLPARLPLIIGAARLAQHLPTDRRQVELFKVFASLANALRSKLQSTRDACRETALHMLRAIGVKYLAGVVRELRRLLTRGPQLAVCAYTVHSLVVALSTGDEPLLTSLDEGVRDMVEATMEDVFGLTAEDRAAVEYRTKVRELRQSKSIDTFEHLARLAEPARVQELLLPLRGVLATSIETKTLRNVDECLRRIASGLSANTHIDTPAFLVLCYTLIAKGEKSLASPPASAPYLSQNAPKFVELGLELLTTALRRSRFDVHDEDTVARLTPLVRTVGETLYATNGPVIERGLRAAAALARCPLPNLAEALPVMQKQMLVLLRSAGGLHSAMAQAALRALSVVLREGRAPPPPTRQLTELLTLVSPELETPVAQASVFALLRAIVSRAFVVPEIYDVMDRIAQLLVVSHDPQVRDICRSLYLQFLLDYPQGQGRLQSQMQFLAKHLSYEKQGGRQSVLELVGAVLSKFSTDVVSQFSELFFVALVMLLANEESTACRQQAAQVMGTLLSAVHAPQRATLMQMTRAWATAQGSAQAQQLASVALRVYELAAERDQGSVAQDACVAIVQALQLGAEEGDADAWRYVYQALQTMQSLVQRDPGVWTSLADTKEPLLTLLTFPHAWCRVSASRVLGASFASQQPWAPSDLVRAAKQLVSQLHSPFLDDALTLQVVRNLVFLGKAFAEGIDEEDAEEEDEEEEEDDDDDDEQAQNDIEDTNPQDDGPPVPARLAWLFSKLSHTARLNHGARNAESAPQRAGAVLKWFAAMTSQLEAPVISRFLVHILSPILRMMDDEQAPEDLKTLANEVQDMVQEHVGPVAFTRVYTHVKQTLLEKRRTRKHTRLLENMADPERAAKRRAARNAGKHMSRKRKNQAFKVQRTGNKRAKGTMRNS